jgi:hypothetical protein
MLWWRAASSRTGASTIQWGGWGFHDLQHPLTGASTDIEEDYHEDYSIAWGLKHLMHLLRNMRFSNFQIFKWRFHGEIAMCKLLPAPILALSFEFYTAPLQGIRKCSALVSDCNPEYIIGSVPSGAALMAIQLCRRS